MAWSIRRIAEALQKQKNTRMRKESSIKKTKVVSFRVTESDFIRYEKECVERHIRMAEILNAAIKNFVDQDKINPNFKILAE